jgi:hypothetical protein
MIEYYVFNDEQTAIAAESMICQLGQTPITGINAATGLPEPTKQKTERWAIPQQRLDGKWVFQRVPESMRANIPEEQQQAFNTNYPHIIETYNPEWFNTEEI